MSSLANNFFFGTENEPHNLRSLENQHD